MFIVCQRNLAIAPMTWFKNFTGKDPQTESESIQLYNLINNYITKVAMNKLSYETPPAEIKEGCA